ncbi:uncharacterized protein LOC111253880 isoform X3 [Varroa destructor]|uniref:Uncharacterized protein n=1 Tax=Varroa destructor TaxID=109461 RepID=A0A7M7KTW2_VARDE|nr:uncharacterized protein LOC111253880 isoform X3 [Varroa destructor]
MVGLLHSHTLKRRQSICRSRTIVMSFIANSRIPRRCTNAALTLFTVIFTLVLIIQDGNLLFDEPGRTAQSLKNHLMLNWSEPPIIFAKGAPVCKVPQFHPLDKEIWPYYRAPPSEIHCKRRQEPMSYMHLETSELEISSRAYLYSCFAEDLLRDGDNGVKFVELRPLFVGRTYLEQRTGVQAIRVTCYNVLKILTYSHIHLVAPKLAPKKIANALGAAPKKRRNVFIFGIDSLSRLAALRMLPLTYKYLVNNLSASVLRSHHKIGDNTFPNLLTILSGNRKKHPNDIHSSQETHMCDKWPLIWKRYAKEGYETFYGEDYPKFATFNYLLNGFINQPTDHYLRPFWLAVESSMVLRSSSLLCYGITPKYKLQLDYLRYFLRRNSTDPYFVFSFLVEISHDYQEYVGAADQDIVSMLELLREQVLSGETLLIVLSDHGHRFDPIRRTRQGHVEERLPLLAIATGDSSQRTTLAYNSNMLTSHYDTYEVLRSLLPARSRPEQTEFGINILDNLVPSNRTCSQAGIPDLYCTCTSQEDAGGFDEGMAIDLAQRAVGFINSMLQKDYISSSACSRLSLKKIASMFLIGYEKVLSLETSPGNALFELRFRDWNDQLEEPMFSRINRYGEPCIRSQTLRKYCYCGR